MTESELDIIISKLAVKLGGPMPRWLKLRAAAHYSSIGQNKLIKLSKAGKIKGFQDTDSKRKDWIFDRLSIDDYRLNQSMSGCNYNEIANDIISSIEV